MSLKAEEIGKIHEYYRSVCESVGIKPTPLPIASDCAYCGDLFYKHSDNHRFCKTSCRVQAYKKRLRAKGGV